VLWQALALDELDRVEALRESERDLELAARLSIAMSDGKSLERVSQDLRQARRLRRDGTETGVLSLDQQLRLARFERIQRRLRRQQRRMQTEP
jgi:hypothetical protein